MSQNRHKLREKFVIGFPTLFTKKTLKRRVLNIFVVKHYPWQHSSFPTAQQLDQLQQQLYFSKIIEHPLIPFVQIPQSSADQAIIKSFRAVNYGTHLCQLNNSHTIMLMMRLMEFDDYLVVSRDQNRTTILSSFLLLLLSAHSLLSFISSHKNGYCG